MTEGMIAVMNRITELQKRFGLYRSEQSDMKSETPSANSFSQILQQQSLQAQEPAGDESVLSGTRVVSGDEVLTSLNSSAAGTRNKVNPAALSAQAARNSAASSYNTKSVIDLILQDKRAVSDAVEQYTQSARDILQNTDETSGDN